VRNGPRLHDFRHRFAIETLLRWYRRGAPVPQRMPVLSTYLGHGNVSGTYWYLSSTPELLAVASKRIETRWKGAVR
jgi:integrase